MPSREFTTTNGDQIDVDTRGSEHKLNAKGELKAKHEKGDDQAYLNKTDMDC